MKNIYFAERLRYYRKLNHLSVQEVAEHLSQTVKPISDKSIYSWENGNSKPSSDMFMSLCELYHISHVLESFGYEDSSKKKNDSKCIYEELTPEEYKIIQAYRNKPELQNAIKSIFQIED